ncbi:MAG: RNA polymerase sigma factor [Candidatus Cyclobacteriaceae bacterium M3_2C_046]
MSKDLHIWKKFKQGNKNSFEFIYRSYYNFLFNYGCKLWQDQDLVKDVIQELFVEIWESRENLSQTDSIKFYLSKALRIKLFKKIGINKRMLNLERSEFYDFQVVLSFEDELISKEFNQDQISSLNKAFSSLSASQREVLFLRYYNQMSLEQIASILNINYQSVKNQIYRSLKQLKKNMTIDSLLICPFLITLLHIPLIIY